MPAAQLLRLVCAALVCAVLFGSNLEAHARGNRKLRAGPDDSYVVFGNGDQGAEAWLALGRGTPAKVPLPKSHWVLDALIDDTRRLWVALGSIPRQGPVQLWRFEGQKTETSTVEGTSATSEIQLLFAGGSIYLATPDGLWSVGGQSPQKLAAWQPESSGFYAASLARSRSGWLLLSPIFNTCGSGDALEALWMFEKGPGGRATRRAIPVPPAPLGRAWLGADGWRYGAGCDGGVGLLGRHGEGRSWPILHREPAPDCSYHLEQNGRFTIVSLGKALLRVHEGHVERLGVADKIADKIEAFYPDQHGRALVLHADGSVVRYSISRPPEVVGRVPTP